MIRVPFAACVVALVALVVAAAPPAAADPLDIQSPGPIITGVITQQCKEFDNGQTEHEWHHGVRCVVAIDPDGSSGWYVCIGYVKEYHNHYNDPDHDPSTAVHEHCDNPI